MNAMLLLKDSETEERGRCLWFERDAKAGCTCDRWGHPSLHFTSDKRKLAPKSKTTRPVVPV